MIISGTTLYKKATRAVLMICALILFSALLPGIVFANGQNSRFILGEVMVKFRNETEPNQLLSEANRSNPPNIEILAPVARLLSEKTGIPLKVKQILSGAWVLLAVDADKLTTQSVTQLRKRNTIAEIQLSPGEAKAIDAFEVKKIDVTFQSSSPEYKVIKAKLAGIANSSFTELIRDLSKTLDLPLQGEVDQRAHLVLEVNLREVTTVLAKRLRSLSELIDLVQLNYVSTAM